MTTFTISTDNNITAFATPEAAQDTLALGAMAFASQKELAKLAAGWPIGRLAEVWNGFAGVAPFGDLKPVKKFTDRKTAVTRIWHAIQKLAPAAEQAAPVAPKQARATKAAKANDNAPAAREGSKKAAVLALLCRPEGATLANIMKATDWQAHSVRGFLSGSIAKKMGLTIESSKNEAGDRTYRIAQ